MVSAAASLVLPRERHTVSAARVIAEELMREGGLGAEVIADLSIAISEACTNVVRHAHGEEYRVEVSVDADACTIVVADHGSGFDVPADPQMPSPHAEGGRGLVLMRALVDDLDVSSAPGGGTVVTMVRRLDEPA
jgi:serine/threonine-protein kinase RsbW